MRTRHRQLAAIAVLVASIPATLQAGIPLGAVADNTLYEDGTGGLSNGGGGHMFCGLAAGKRRALVRFDVAGSVPAGAVITNATLTLNMTRTNPANTAVPIGLHRVTSVWGEGRSDAGDPGGAGTTAQPGDATWLHTFWPSSYWTTAGGDFTATTSATTIVQGIDAYDWTSAQLIADVQDMLDDPASNFGWILIGDEASGLNAKRFSTRESFSGGPVLAIEYKIPPVGVTPSQWSAVKSLFR